MKTLTREDTISLGATFNSAPIHLENLEGYSICLVWAGGGSPVGSLKLQASNNAFLNNVNNNVNPDATWVDITGSTYAVSADGTYFWNVADCYYNSVRYVYTRTSGTATGSGFIWAKGIT